MRHVDVHKVFDEHRVQPVDHKIDDRVGRREGGVLDGVVAVLFDALRLLGGGAHDLVRDRREQRRPCVREEFLERHGVGAVGVDLRPEDVELGLGKPLAGEAVERVAQLLLVERTVVTHIALVVQLAHARDLLGRQAVHLRSANERVRPCDRQLRDANRRVDDDGRVLHSLLAA